MKETASHYHNNLSKPSAKQALEYMEKRQLSGSVATRFGIGYADGYNDLPDYLKSKGYTVDEMLAVGVVKQKDGRVYDPVANRVIFPIIDIYGNVIAFGGRTLESNPNFAKYLNTAETELFNKRNTLYAVNYLKKQRQLGPIPYVIVVEGYMDTISLHKAGFTMTVASMGTALTQSQAKMIKRFADKVYICYDGDSAGQNATLRGLDILRENGLDVMVVQLPDKFDPDDVIKTYGREGYQKILNEALSELRDQEFSQLFADRRDTNTNFVNDCFVESDMELMLPNWYVESQTERIALYRELDNIQTEQALTDYCTRLTDRFGRIPDEAKNLMTMVRLRWIAQRYGVERLLLKNGKMNAYLVSNSQSPFYSSNEFNRMLQYCFKNARRCALIEKAGKNIIQINNIPSVDEAYNLFQQLNITS
jgi:DNA primase catalytic core